MLAPPESIASISSFVQGFLWNLAGNSLLSKTSPCPASTLPRLAPERSRGPAGGNGKGDDDKGEDNCEDG